MTIDRLFFAATGIAACLSTTAWAQDAVPAYVRMAVADIGRPPPDINRDSQFKPAAVMAFSGIAPGQRVVDWVPVDGYYTRILSKMVGLSGHVYALVPVPGIWPDIEHLRAAYAAVAAKGEHPAPIAVDMILPIENIAEYSNMTVLWEMLWQYNGQFSVPEQVDAVFVRDAYHDLHGKKYGVPDMAVLDKALFDTLKPGGTLTVSDNVAAPGTGFDAVDALHRSDPDTVKSELMSVGFSFDGQSDALANTADDHTRLAEDPTLKGMPDRFLLRFKKPMNASGYKRPPKGGMDGFYGNTSISGLENPSPRHRWVFYHPDGTYQEFGANDMQSGLWYWDAAGHNCMLHEYPIEQRGFVVCHATATFKKPGDEWEQDNGQPFQGPHHRYTIAPGIVYPPTGTMNVSKAAN